MATGKRKAAATGDTAPVVEETPVTEPNPANEEPQVGEPAADPVDDGQAAEALRLEALARLAAGPQHEAPQPGAPAPAPVVPANGKRVAWPFDGDAWADAVVVVDHVSKGTWDARRGDTLTADTVTIDKLERLGAVRRIEE